MILQKRYMLMVTISHYYCRLVPSNRLFSSSFAWQSNYSSPKQHIANNKQLNNSSFSYFHTQSKLFLNRILFDPSEVTITLQSPHLPDDSATTTPAPASSLIDTNEILAPPYVILPKDDYRTVHAAKILNLQNGDTLRAGIILDRDDNNCTTTLYAGYVTDQATIEWLPEGKNKKAQPTKNGDPPGSLRVTLDYLTSPSSSSSSSSSSLEDQNHSLLKNQIDSSSHISLILALPRPITLARLLPMIAQLGVRDLILTSAAKVPKDYFGSHLFRKPDEIRKLLIEGLCQAGDVTIPTVKIVKRLKPFLEDELDVLYPKDKFARVIAHPQRIGNLSDDNNNNNNNNIMNSSLTTSQKRMRDIIFPIKQSQSQTGELDTIPQKNILLAVGPEGGWVEPYELEMFQKLGFQQITLGTRILRTDVAVISLLSLAHDTILSSCTTTTTTTTKTNDC